MSPPQNGEGLSGPSGILCVKPPFHFQPLALMELVVRATSLLGPGVSPGRVRAFHFVM